MNQKTNTQIEQLSRRAFLQKMSVVLGASSAASVLSLSAVKHALAFVPNASDNKTKVFSVQQFGLLKQVVDAVMPQTATPSASQLDCHGFIDHQLFHCYNEKEQQAALALIETINTASDGKFSQLSIQQQQALLVKIESQQGFTAVTQGQFKQLKALLVFAYFTTEIGASQVLNYQAVPGPFKGSIKADENTKTWGSLGFY